MIKINFNRSAKFLFVLIAALASGCAEQATQSFAFDEQYPHYPYHSSGEAAKQHKNNSWNKSVKKKGFNENNLIWDRLISLYALPEVNDPRVDRELNWYLDHPDYIARVQQRAEPYLYQIVNEIEAQHIPGEMALLPIVESAFKPEAVSTASAAGLWQFMPATGRLFGLEQNHWYDGRRDIYRSTQAAASYLKDLSATFDGDWLLALASYNYGKGNVQKAIDRNSMNGEPTDFWSLRDLPQETKTYVPKLLAIAKLFAHAEEYNIPLHPIRDKPFFEVVEIGAAMNLDQAAAMANTNSEQFQKLNPGYKNNVTAPDGPHHLLIPVDHVHSFKKKLEQIPAEEKELLGQQLKNEELRIAAAKRAEELARKAREDAARKAAEQEMLARKAAEERLAKKKAQEEATRLAFLKKHPGAKYKKPAESSHEPHETVIASKKGGVTMKLAQAHTTNSKETTKETAKLNAAVNKLQAAVNQKATLKGKPQLLATATIPNSKIAVNAKKSESASNSNPLKKVNLSDKDKLVKNTQTGIKKLKS